MQVTPHSTQLERTQAYSTRGRSKRAELVILFLGKWEVAQTFGLAKYLLLSHHASRAGQRHDEKLLIECGEKFARADQMTDDNPSNGFHNVKGLKVFLRPPVCPMWVSERWEKISMWSVPCAKTTDYHRWDSQNQGELRAWTSRLIFETKLFLVKAWFHAAT